MTKLVSKLLVDIKRFVVDKLLADVKLYSVSKCSVDTKHLASIFHLTNLTDLPIWQFTKNIRVHCWWLICLEYIGKYWKIKDSTDIIWQLGPFQFHENEIKERHLWWSSFIFDPNHEMSDNYNMRCHPCSCNGMKQLIVHWLETFVQLRFNKKSSFS